MPTESLKAILDRDLSHAAAAQLIDVASPLLQEIVNYSTNLFGRCQSSISPEKHEDNAIPYLYLHMIEMTDAIEVLISKSCVNPSLPLLRSSFESLISIDYITREKSVQRALAWAAEYARNRLNAVKLYDTSSERGKNFIESFETEITFVEGKLPDKDSVKNKITEIKGLLSENQFKEVEAERRKLKKKYRWPKWYQLFDGPKDLAELSAVLGRKCQYDILYGYWSSIAHAHDISRHFKKTNNKLVFVGLRDSSDMARAVKLAASFLMEASIKTAQYYRPDDERFIAEWYFKDVRELFNKI